jgi:hypothetical protein
MRSAPLNTTLGDSPVSGHQTDGAVAKNALLILGVVAGHFTPHNQRMQPAARAGKRACHPLAADPRRLYIINRKHYEK